jgi:hypothetical protein
MSDNTAPNQFEAVRPALSHTRAFCLFLPLQKNNQLTVDLLEKGTLEIEQTNPMFCPPLRPKPAIPQPLAVTAVSPASNPKFAIFRGCLARAACGFIYDRISSGFSSRFQRDSERRPTSAQILKQRSGFPRARERQRELLDGLGYACCIDAIRTYYGFWYLLLRLPLYISNFNNRHSIGPLYISIRRDVLRPICLAAAGFPVKT